MLRKTFFPDMLAGLTVSFAALSLGAAFGTLSGRGAFAGMIAASIIPILASIFGGTRRQASGPTAPMTAVSALVIAYAYEAFDVETNKILAEQFISLVFLLTAVFLIIAGILKLGQFISYIPQVVILGFMNGIALLIWMDQAKRLIGFGGVEALSGGVALNTILAFVTLGLIFLIPFLLKKVRIPENIRAFIPAILITIVVMTLFTVLSGLDIQRVALGSSVSSISEYWGLITAYFPSSAVFTQELILKAVPFALQLTLLAYLDSLLTALVMDKLTKEKTKLNKEVIAQGLANGASAIFLGIPGAQATIRSVLLYNEGAQTRLAGVFVGVFALLGLLVFQNYITLIASAIFAGVLFKVGWDVLDKDFIKSYTSFRWSRSKMRNIQLGFIVYTTLITVLFDLNIAVISGTILFYIGKKFFAVRDVEEGFAEISESEDDTIHV